ncbi:Wzz/FepE/Etk N-terminal domain-containing protein [Haliea salexigens]|uniref:Wzz/FepE/Etk N-terminal domain-containing protein n=1 Tax=Haliea salexigens TaxID=287487 RepID=UPI000487A7EC|nr:Wzz/FepE/Etk N-terminal domain-containing protein [Haliea salexigens]
MTQPGNHPSLSQLPPPAWADDEIDLFELVVGLWRRKWVVLAVIAVALALAAAYLLLTTPVYESSARLRPPLASQLAAINETGQLTLSPEEAFGRVIFEARAISTQRQVFDAFKERFLNSNARSDALAEQYFLLNFLPASSTKVDGSGKNDVLAETTATITFKHADNQFAADISNALATAARSRARAGVLDDLRVVMETRIRVLESRIVLGADELKRNDQDTVVQLQEADELRRRDLQDQIAALTRKTRQLRLDKITELQEALAIAQSLGIEDPVTMHMMSNRDGGNESVAFRAELSDGTRDPLYLRGSRMLEAELAALEQRTSDAHMEPRLRDLQEQLDLLEKNRRIELLQGRENYEALAENTGALRAEITQLRNFLAASYADVKMARVDKEAVARKTPIRPKKALTVAIALIAGTMLGILIALVMAAVQNRRQPPPAADTAQ